jgi:hypothetical protein
MATATFRSTNSSPQQVEESIELLKSILLRQHLFVQLDALNILLGSMQKSSPDNFSLAHLVYKSSCW